MKLVELKVFLRTDDEHDHYQLTNAWMKYEYGIPWCKGIGCEDWFPFPDRFCPGWLGEYPAIILNVIHKSRDMEADRVIKVVKGHV